MSFHFRSSWALLTLTLVGFSACAPSDPVDPDEAEDVGEAEEALTTCVTIQRGATGNIYDTALLGDYSGWATGGDYSLHTGASSGGNRNISLLKADLSPIPQGAVLVSATLNLKASWSADNSNVNVYPVLAPWDEATATTSNFNVATGIGANAIGSFPGGNGGAKNVNVTPLVGQWLSGAVANNGVALNDAGASSHLLWSSECSPDNQPSLTVCYDPPVVNPQPQPPSAWSRSPAVYGIGADLAGNTVGTNGFTGTLNLGTGPITSVSTSYDLYVVKYGPTGTPLWTKRFGDEAILNNEGPRNQFGSAIATDAAGNVFVTGTFKGQLGNLQSPGNQFKPDTFVLKLDPDGNTVWAQQHSMFSFVTSPKLKVDSQGRPVVMAGCSGPVDGVMCAGGAFIVKEDTNGAKLWRAQCQSGAPSNYFEAFTKDGSDNTILGGTMSQSSSTSFDCGTGSKFIQGKSDFIFVKHDTNGNVVWIRQFPTTNGGGLSDLAADSAGNIYAAITVFFGGTGTFGATVLQPGTYLAKFDSNGTLQSALPFTATPRGLTVDPSGNVVMVGSFSNTVDFGFGPVSSIGPTDIFIWRLSPTFTPQKFLRVGTPNTTNFSSRIAVDGFGAWSFTGELNGGSWDFGQGPLSGSFLAKIVN